MPPKSPQTSKEHGISLVPFVIFIAIVGVFAIWALSQPASIYLLGSDQTTSAQGEREFETMAAALVTRGIPGERVRPDGTVLQTPNPAAEVNIARQLAASNGYPMPPSHCFSRWRSVKTGDCNGPGSTTMSWFEIGCGTGLPNPKCTAAAIADIEKSSECVKVMFCLQKGHQATDDVVLIPSTKTQQVLASSINIPGLPPPPPPCPPNCGLGKPPPKLPELPDPPSDHGSGGSKGLGGLDVID